MQESDSLLDAVSARFFEHRSEDMLLSEMISVFHIFWCDASRSHLVDEELYKIYIAAATDDLLYRGAYGEDHARSRTRFAIDIQELAKIGVFSFLNNGMIRGQDRECAEARGKVLTRDGLVRYLARTIPCSCLDDLKKQVKAEVKEGPKMGICWLCDKVDTKVKIYKCSRCLKGKYCSKACQAAHWTHEPLCSLIFKQK
jgi:hypothetical protein